MSFVSVQFAVVPPLDKKRMGLKMFLLASFADYWYSPLLNLCRCPCSQSVRLSVKLPPLPTATDRRHNLFKRDRAVGPRTAGRVHLPLHRPWAEQSGAPNARGRHACTTLERNHCMADDDDDDEWI